MLSVFVVFFLITTEQQFATTLGRSILVCVLYILKQHGLQWDWRYMLVITQVAVVATDCFPTFSRSGTCTVVGGSGSVYRCSRSC